MFVSLVDLGETMSLLCFPRQPSCSLCLVLSLLLLVFRLFIYFSVILFCFITFPFNPSYSFCVYFFLSQFFSLFMSPSLLSVLFFPPRLFFSLSSRHKSLSCWLLKCEEWQIWWFLTAVTGVPRFTSLHCPLWSWLSDLKAKYTRHE